MDWPSAELECEPETVDAKMPSSQRSFTRDVGDAFGSMIDRISAMKLPGQSDDSKGSTDSTAPSQGPAITGNTVVHSVPSPVEPLYPKVNELIVSMQDAFNRSTSLRALQQCMKALAVEYNSLLLSCEPHVTPKACMVCVVNASSSDILVTQTPAKSWTILPHSANAITGNVEAKRHWQDSGIGAVEAWLDGLSSVEVGDIRPFVTAFAAAGAESMDLVASLSTAEVRKILAPLEPTPRQLEVIVRSITSNDVQKRLMSRPKPFTDSVTASGIGLFLLVDEDWLQTDQFSVSHIHSGGPRRWKFGNGIRLNYIAVRARTQLSRYFVLVEDKDVEDLTVHTFENQRWYPFKGWTDNLLAGDPMAWSTGSQGHKLATKSSFSPPPNAKWDGDWKLDLSLGGEQGWQYSSSFTGGWQRKSSALTVVRRRKWIRRVRSDENKVAAPSPDPVEPTEAHDEDVNPFEDSTADEKKSSVLSEDSLAGPVESSVLSAFDAKLEAIETPQSFFSASHSLARRWYDIENRAADPTAPTTHSHRFVVGIINTSSFDLRFLQLAENTYNIPHARGGCDSDCCDEDVAAHTIKQLQECAADAREPNVSDIHATSAWNPAGAMLLLMKDRTAVPSAQNAEVQQPVDGAQSDEEEEEVEEDTVDNTVQDATVQDATNSSSLDQASYAATTTTTAASSSSSSTSTSSSSSPPAAAGPSSSASSSSTSSSPPLSQKLRGAWELAKEKAEEVADELTAATVQLGQDVNHATAQLKQEAVRRKTQQEAKQAADAEQRGFVNSNLFDAANLHTGYPYIKIHGKVVVELSPFLYFDKHVPMRFLVVKNQGKGSLEVRTWENQRWFPVKGWTSDLMASDRPPWSDSEGERSTPKQSFSLPVGMKWDGDWTVDEHTAYHRMHANHPSMARRGKLCNTCWGINVGVSFVIQVVDRYKRGMDLRF